MKILTLFQPPNGLGGQPRTTNNDIDGGSCNRQSESLRSVDNLALDADHPASLEPVPQKEQEEAQQVSIFVVDPSER